jgi:hypothetical protein
MLRTGWTSVRPRHGSKKLATMPQERRSRGGPLRHCCDACRITWPAAGTYGEDLGLMDSERNHGDVVGPDPVKSATH